jgi:hypothetical protein
MLRTSHKFGSALMLLVAITLATGSIASAHGDEKQHKSRVPVPQHSITKGDKCVEPTDVMRKRHMEFILHQRDETMHKGIRTKQHSLKNCVNCHADPKTGSVLGKNGFCESCHAYAAVSIDCFSCHSDKANSAEQARHSPIEAAGQKVMAITGVVK